MKTRNRSTSPSPDPEQKQSPQQEQTKNPSQHSGSDSSQSSEASNFSDQKRKDSPQKQPPVIPQREIRKSSCESNLSFAKESYEYLKSENQSQSQKQSQKDERVDSKIGQSQTDSLKFENDILKNTVDIEKGLERIELTSEQVQDVDNFDFNRFDEMVKESRRGLKLTQQAQKNNQPAENYLLYRDPKPTCDKYLEECFVEVTKPITPAEREKIML